MLLVTRRPRLVLVAAAVAVVTLVAALTLGSRPEAANPRLHAPGNHATVSVEDSVNGPVAMGNGVSMGASLRNDKSAALQPVLPATLDGHQAPPRARTP